MKVTVIGLIVVSVIGFVFSGTYSDIGADGFASAFMGIGLAAGLFAALFAAVAYHANHATSNRHRSDADNISDRMFPAVLVSLCVLAVIAAITG